MTAAGIVFFPLIGAMIAGLFGRFIGDRAAQLFTCGGMVLSAICAWIVLFSVVGTEGYKIDVLTWIQSGTFEVDWTIRVDPLSAVMMFVVSTVSTLIHIYSIGYMSHDPHVPRFMAYLSLFTFFMLALVTADNFLQLFFGWEGVGLVSYLLIGFWYTKPSACAAAIKAFLVNRVGDVGFALGIAGVYLVFDSVEFDVVFSQAAKFAEHSIVLFGTEVHALTLVTFLLFIGAMGKSAQLGLHTWLPDAMEGPTPVSALIHAATMVTAGVFLVARCSPLFEHSEWTLGFVTFIGASTAFFAATIGLVQNDIKRVIAYSTCSQLGYMFFAAGVGAYPVAIFHLYTHAFFKALLFLSAGSVIHAMSDEQDMRNMGGIWRKIPVTYAMMWIGSLALAGIPIFAGFFSKDLILEVAWASHGPFAGYAFWLGIAAAVMTAFYSWRLLFMTFHGEPRASEEVMHHVHESPLVMTIPLGLLAVGAIFAGLLGLPMVNPDMAFWGGSIAMPHEHNIIEEAHHAAGFGVKMLPLLAGAIGIALAYVFYIMNPALPRELAAKAQGVYQFLLNKWYIDELYDFLFVNPAKRLGTLLWRGGDIGIIDTFGPNGVAAATLSAARRATMLQTGYVYHYAFAMLIGIAALVTWYVFRF
ncbi:MAG: NADH-quinone oxidoreductase subunit L [Alphaproteobacteria bacterium]